MAAGVRLAGRLPVYVADDVAQALNVIGRARNGLAQYSERVLAPRQWADGFYPAVDGVRAMRSWTKALTGIAGDTVIVRDAVRSLKPVTGAPKGMSTALHTLSFELKGQAAKLDLALDWGRRQLRFHEGVQGEVRAGVALLDDVERFLRSIPV